MARKPTAEQLAARLEAERELIATAAAYEASTAYDRTMRGHWYAAIVAAQEVGVQQTRIGWLTFKTREHARRVYDNWLTDGPGYRLDVDERDQALEAAQSYLERLDRRLRGDGEPAHGVAVDIDDEPLTKAELAAQAWMARKLADDAEAVAVAAREEAEAAEAERLAAEEAEGDDPAEEAREAPEAAVIGA